MQLQAVQMDHPNPFNGRPDTVAPYTIRQKVFADGKFPVYFEQNGAGRTDGVGKA